MKHVGIDLGARKSHLVTLENGGEERPLSTVPTAELPSLFARMPKSRIVMEACTQSPALARFAMDAGHEVIVVAGNLVRALGVGARGIKTDAKDAEVLALASLRNLDLQSVHLRSAQAQSQQELLQARGTLVSARRAVANAIKSKLRGELIVLQGRASSSAFVEAVRRAALEQMGGLSLAMETQLATFQHLTEQIEKLAEEIERLAEQDRICTLLRTIPGVGPIVALAFRSHLDTHERFANADHLASYLALVPGEATTGGKTKRTGTIKAGPVYLKALLVQAVWSMWRTKPNDPLVVWGRAIAEKRGRRIAVIAMARKLATVMWSMWKHDVAYDAGRASIARAQPSSGPPIANHAIAAPNVTRVSNNASPVQKKTSEPNNKASQPKNKPSRAASKTM